MTLVGKGDAMAILSDDLDSVAAEIQQGFMQRGGFKACRYLLGKLVEEIEERDHGEETQLVQIAKFIGRDASTTEGVNSIAEVVEEEIGRLRKAALAILNNAMTRPYIEQHERIALARSLAPMDRRHDAPDGAA